MNGPFVINRNKWQRTPLERIEQAIEEIKEEIKMEDSKTNNSRIIEDLSKTLETLEEEGVNLKIRVRKLKIKRETLIGNLTWMRRNKFDSEKNNKIQKIFKKITKIDKELGPYRNHDTRFYLD